MYVQYIIMIGIVYNYTPVYTFNAGLNMKLCKGRNILVLGDTGTHVHLCIIVLLRYTLYVFNLMEFELLEMWKPLVLCDYQWCLVTVSCKAMPRIPVQFHVHVYDASILLSR